MPFKLTLSPLLLFVAAELLRQSHHHRVPEEDRHLLQAADRRERGDHLRLQVPHRGEQDSLPVRDRELPGHLELTLRVQGGLIGYLARVTAAKKESK